MNLRKFSLLVIIPCFVFSDDIKSDQSGNTVAYISRAKLVQIVAQQKQQTSDPDLKRDQPCFVFASHGPEKSVELESFLAQSSNYALLVPFGTVIVSGVGASVPVVGQA